MIPYISEALETGSFGWTEEIVGENKNGAIKQLIMEGEFQEAESPNRNRRMYSESLLRRETNNMIQFIKDRNGLPCELNHPLPADSEAGKIAMQRIDQNNVCALCMHLEMNNRTVYGKATILEDDMSQGTKLASMIRHGFKPAVSSRGFGSDPIPAIGRPGYYYVPEDYKMLTYDFVTQPSVFNAVLKQFNEEQEFIFSQAQKSSRTLVQVLTDFRNKNLK